jgi:hypothetical protein
MCLFFAHTPLLESVFSSLHPSRRAIASRHPTEVSRLASSGIYKGSDRCGLKTGRTKIAGPTCTPRCHSERSVPMCFLRKLRFLQFPSGHVVEARILPPCFSANPSSLFRNSLASSVRTLAPRNFLSICSSDRPDASPAEVHLRVGFRLETSGDLRLSFPFEQMGAPRLFERIRL